LMGLTPGRAGYIGARRLQYYRDVLDRVRALPGIEGASLALITPISGSGVDLSLVLDGKPAEPGNMVYVNDVADGYFGTMGTALLLGRDFTREDREESAPVAIINDALARRYFPSSVPIGQRVRLGKRSVLEIVGVVRNTKYVSLREQDHPTIYVNALQKLDTGGLTLSVRVAGDPSAATAAIRREVSAVAAAVPIGRTSVLSAEIDRSLVNERLMANLLGAFAALALVLAGAGLYGVLGYAVARRTNEIGLRLALGATRRAVLWSVLGDCARLVTIGLVAGVAGAFLATRLLSDLLFGVTTTDLRVFSAVVASVAAVAAVSAFRPAWRASRVDPWVALKHN
jgi:putative ABC transport system permease protein